MGCHEQFYRHRVNSAAAASVGNVHWRMERLSRETRESMVMNADARI